MSALVAAWLIASVSGQQSGAPGPSTPLSLAEAQAEARAHAPEVAELGAALGGARLTADDARRVFRSDPTLTLGYAPGALIGKADEWSASAGLTWRVDVSGSWALRRDSAAANMSRVQWDTEGGLLALDEAVAVALADLALAQRAQIRSKRIAALFTVAAEAARKSLEVGEGNQLELDAAELDLSGAVATSAQDDVALEYARVRLARRLGRQDGSRLVALDEPPTLVFVSAVDVQALVDAAPQVRAAEADVKAAQLDVALQDRLVIPQPTLGAEFGLVRRGIPSSAFMGPAAANLSANWTDSDLGFTLSVPIPVLERNHESRTRAQVRALGAEAKLTRLRADVRTEIEGALSALRSASAGYQALAKTTELVDRDFLLLDKTVRAGALDAVARALALRRLEGAAVRADQALWEMRVALAGWTRRSRAMTLEVSEGR